MRRWALLAVASWPLWWVAGACTTATVAPDGGADGTTDGGGDGAACVWVYTTAGCDAAPICAGPEFDACAMFFCGCDGKTFYGGCGVNGQPFASLGYCDGDVPDGYGSGQDAGDAD